VEAEDAVKVIMSVRVTGITVIPPVKLLYYVGESFDETGIVVKKVMASGEDTVLSAGYTVSGLTAVQQLKPDHHRKLYGRRRGLYGYLPGGN
jgi:hypothetical protein